MVTATLPLSLALILATHLVVEYVIGKAAALLSAGATALLSAGATALLIAVVWWAIPLLRKRQARR